MSIYYVFLFMGKIELLKETAKTVTVGLFGLYVSFSSFLDPMSNRYEIRHQSRNVNVVSEEDNVEVESSKIYALLINSKDNDFLHNFSGEIDSIYQSLIKAGVSTDNIYIIDAENNKRIANNFSSSLSGIDNSIKDLSNKIDKDDHFILYLTNHGGKNKKNSNSSEVYVKLKNKRTLKVSDLEEKLKPIKPKTSLMVFPPCFSGAFANRLGKGNIIAISTTTEDRIAYSIGLYSVDILATRFFPKLLDPSKYDKNTDLNKDGKISIEEAFIDTANNDLLNNPLSPWRNIYQLRYENTDTSDISYKTSKNLKPNF